MAIKKVQLSVQKLLLGSLLTLVWSLPVKAQADLLTRAQISELENQVQLLLRNKSPRQARLNDVLVPLDALATKAQSRAGLIFNEGSYTSIGSNSVFRFKPGMRRYELPGGGLRSETILEFKQGIAVVLVPPGGFTTKVETTQGDADIFAPQISQISYQSPSDIISSFKASTLPAIPDYRNKDAKFLNSDTDFIDINFAKKKVDILKSQISQQPTSQFEQLPLDITENFQGSALAVVTDDVNKKSIFLNLTPHVIAINNPQRTQTVILRGGQTVTVKNGIIGEVQNFDLKKFYKTTKLAAGLGPGQENLIPNESEQVQKTFRLLRKQTLQAIENQELWVNGLCTLNSRGSASTLSTNCITTGNDPVDKFEDIRDTLQPQDNDNPTQEILDTGTPDGGAPDTANPDTVNPDRIP